MCRYSTFVGEYVRRWTASAHTSSSAPPAFILTHTLNVLQHSRPTKKKKKHQSYLLPLVKWNANWKPRQQKQIVLNEFSKPKLKLQCKERAIFILAAHLVPQQKFDSRAMVCPLADHDDDVDWKTKGWHRVNICAVIRPHAPWTRIYSSNYPHHRGQLLAPYWRLIFLLFSLSIIDESDCQWSVLNENMMVIFVSSFNPLNSFYRCCNRQTVMHVNISIPSSCRFGLSVEVFSI